MSCARSRPVTAAACPGRVAWNAWSTALRTASARPARRAAFFVLLRGHGRAESTARCRRAARPIHLRPTAPLADRVLLPGDPGRALLLAQELLTEPKMFNHHRGLWGYTGAAADGEPLTIQATGMGGPSAAIVLEELFDLGVTPRDPGRDVRRAGRRRWRSATWSWPREALPTDGLEPRARRRRARRAPTPR